MRNIQEAFRRVNREEFVRKEDGSLIPQITSDTGIRNSLELLDAQMGQRVLEIGTGSGYSTALLAHLVGPTGLIVSVDIEPTLTERAKQMFAERDLRHVRFVTQDGRNGWEASAPYDRIVAWTTPDQLPEVWPRQMKEGGWIVSPFRVLPLAHSGVVVRLRKMNGKLKGDDVIKGSYIAMTEKTPEKFFGPWIHAEWVGTGEDPWWASSSWMRKNEDPKWVHRFLNANPTPSPIPDTGDDLRPFLLAMAPDSLTTAVHPEYGSFIGTSSPEGFALASLTERQWLISDEKQAKTLMEWWENWKRKGKPSYHRLKADLVGNQVHVKLKKEDES